MGTKMSFHNSTNICTIVYVIVIYFNKDYTDKTLKLNAYTTCKLILFWLPSRFLRIGIK